MWVDVAKKGVAEDIDYAELEKVFSAETQEIKRPNIGTKLYPYLYTMPLDVHSCLSRYFPYLSLVLLTPRKS